MFHVKRQLLALFMPGFLLGILYVNLEAEHFVYGLVWRFDRTAIFFLV